MKIFQATLSALAISQANGNAITCDIDSLISVICSAETGMKVSVNLNLKKIYFFISLDRS